MYNVIVEKRRVVSADMLVGQDVANLYLCCGLAVDKNHCPIVNRGHP